MDNSLDWGDALRAVHGNPQLLTTIAEAALEEVPRLCAAIRRAVAEGDAARLRLAAHTLKGSLRYFGATGAFECARQLEQLGQEHRLAEALPLLDSLDEEVGKVTMALTDFLRKGSSGGGTEQNG